ncbi:amidohydrolase [Pseudodesulfovibrio sp. zrk46]|uniref:amidohydrolase family protein n=1 Tax=Pseudodesulfovibrio sp. zrk46 TaxID=2725288 RepID=UPI0014499A64|nr:amidohydrolase [Pseudodesulfovibrio sp. zrk46]QJB57672.1 amidohydrolase [Pseudodesulfovibrio sp. zrk46]
MNCTNASETCDLLIRADVVVTQDDSRTIVNEAGVAVSDGLVVEVGSYDELNSRFAPESHLDMSGKMLMPGLVNGHIHLPMTLFRGYADDMPLMQWLEDHIWPVEFKLTDEMLKIGARIGCAELLRSGCTAFLNGYFYEYITGEVASACGLRAVLGEGFFSFPSPHFPTAQHCWDTIKELNDRFIENPLIRTAVTPHAAFTVRPELLTESYELACDLNIQWQTHIAESPVETDICLKKYGKRPIEILRDAGVLSERTTLAHCVDLTDDEVALLAETGVTVVHNPASNQKLCSGLAPVQKLLDGGVHVALGTDGASSNNGLNMFRDMGLAGLAGKIQGMDASAVPAQAVLDMATRGSARALGWPELGRIQKGCPADIIALDLASPNMMPMYNPVSHAVYAATGGEVCMTMVAGEILYLYGDFRSLDVRALRDEAFRAKSWVLKTAENQK